MALLTLPLAGCMQPVGDLGRRENGFTSTTLDAAVERLVVLQAPEIANNLERTDVEKDLDNRLWRFLTLPHTREWIYPGRAGVHRVAYLRDRPYLPAEDSHYKNLKAQHFTSSGVQYRSLIADIEADRATLPALYQSFCRVQELDRQRKISLRAFGELEPEVQQNVANRMAENRLVEQHFSLMLEFRYTAYSYTLKRLLVEAPDEQARSVDANLSDLSSFVAQANQGDFCGQPSAASRGKLGLTYSGS